MTEKTSNGMDTAIQIGLIALLALWCFKIAAPFISPIVWAGIIAIAIYPLHQILIKKTGMTNGWASTVLTLAMLVFLITPTVMLTEALIDNAKTLSTYLVNDELRIPPPSEGVGDWPIIGEKVEAFWQLASEDHSAAFGQYDSQIKSVVSWVASSIAATGLNILIFVFSIIIAGVFVASADGAKLAMQAIFTRVAGQQRGPELCRCHRCRSRR